MHLKNKNVNIKDIQKGELISNSWFLIRAGSKLETQSNNLCNGNKVKWSPLDKTSSKLALGSRNSVVRESYTKYWSRLIL